MHRTSLTPALAYLSGLTLPRGLNFVEGEGQPPAPPPVPGAPKVTVNIDKEFIDKLTDANKGLDLNAKVKIGDQQVSISQLIANSQAAATATASAAQLKQQFDDLQLHIKSAYDTSDKADLGKAKDGMTAILKTAGVPDDQIAKDIAEMFGGGNGQQQQQQQQQRQPEDLRYKAIVEELNERIETAAHAPFESHPILKDIMGAKTKMFNEEIKQLTMAGKTQEVDALKKEHETFQEEWKEQALKDLNNRLSARKSKEGTFSIKWVKEEGAKTADMIASKLRRATGDPRFMGKAPATAAESPLSVLDKRPVERPRAEYGKTNLADLEQKLDDYGVDKFLRASAEDALGKAGSAM